MNEDQKTTPPDLELLGQKFYLPNSKLKLIGFGMILLCILTPVMLLIIHRYELKKTADGWSVKRGEVTDEKVNLKKGFIIGFWTPSDNTKEGLHLTAKDSAEYSWQIKPEKEREFGHTFDSLNILFGDEIKFRFRFKGYRRYKVLGEGDKSFKEGWWWNIGFEGNCDDQFLKEFKTEYIKFWHPSAIGIKEWDKLYIEVTGN